MKDQILKLREEGLTYAQIAKEIGCSKSTVCYNIDITQKDKSNARKRKSRKNNPVLNKLNAFRHRVRDFQRKRSVGGNFIEGREYNFNIDDIFDKIGENPICYLTGRKIDLSKSRTYHLDHIEPTSKGGSSDISNLGLSCKDANLAKRDLSVEEYIQLCIDTLRYNGYKIIKEV